MLSGRLQRCLCFLSTSVEYFRIWSSVSMINFFFSLLGNDPSSHPVPVRNTLLHTVSVSRNHGLAASINSSGDSSALGLM